MRLGQALFFSCSHGLFVVGSARITDLLQSSFVNRMDSVQLFSGPHSLLATAVRRNDDRSFIVFMQTWPTTPGLDKPGLRSAGHIWVLSAPRTCTLRARNRETRDGPQSLDPIPPHPDIRSPLEQRFPALPRWRFSSASWGKTR